MVLTIFIRCLQSVNTIKYKYTLYLIYKLYTLALCAGFILTFWPFGSVLSLLLVKLTRLPCLNTLNGFDLFCTSTALLRSKVIYSQSIVHGSKLLFGRRSSHPCTKRQGFTIPYIYKKHWDGKLVPALTDREIFPT